MKKLLWMRVGARVLANGSPAEIVSVWSENVEGVEHVHYIDVCMDGKTEIECFRPDAVQRDRIRVSQPLTLRA